MSGHLSADDHIEEGFESSPAEERGRRSVGDDLFPDNTWSEDLFLEDVMVLEAADQSREEMPSGEFSSMPESSLAARRRGEAARGSATERLAAVGEARLEPDACLSMFMSPEVSPSRSGFVTGDMLEIVHGAADASQESEEEEAVTGAGQEQLAVALKQAGEDASGGPSGSGPRARRWRPMSPANSTRSSSLQRMGRLFWAGSGLSDVGPSGEGAAAGLGFASTAGSDRCRLNPGRLGGSLFAGAGGRREPGGEAAWSPGAECVRWLARASSSAPAGDGREAEREAGGSLGGGSGFGIAVVPANPEAGERVMPVRQPEYMEARAADWATLRMRRQERREARGDFRQQEEGWLEFMRQVPRGGRGGAGPQQQQQLRSQSTRMQPRGQEDGASPSGGALGGTPFSKRPKFWGLAGRRSPPGGAGGPGLGSPGDSPARPVRDPQVSQPVAPANRPRPSGMWGQGGSLAASSSGLPSSPPATPPKARKFFGPWSAGDGRGPSDPMDADSDDSFEGPPGARDHRRRLARRRWPRDGRRGWGEENNGRERRPAGAGANEGAGLGGRGLEDWGAERGGSEEGRAGDRGPDEPFGNGRSMEEEWWDARRVSSRHGRVDEFDLAAGQGGQQMSGASRGKESDGAGPSGSGWCQESSPSRGLGKGGQKEKDEGSRVQDEREKGTGDPTDKGKGTLEVEERRWPLHGGEREERGSREGAGHVSVSAPRQGKPVEAESNAGPQYELAEDSLYKVFSFLDQTDLCRAALVCRQWRVTSEQEEFWKHLNFENRRATHRDVGRLCAKYPGAVTLNLRGAPCVDEALVRDAMRNLRSLETLILGNGYLSDAFFRALAAGCQTLHTLKVSEAVLGSGGAQEIQIRHNGLRDLEIVGCRVLRMAVRCPALRTLSLKRTTAASAALLCPDLTQLNVSYCHKLSDSGVRAAATACPQLTSLDISHCAFVSDETLRDIAAACSNLSHLNASHCPNLSLEGVRLHSMVDLTLNACEGINATSIPALSHCRLLETLRLDWCCMISSVSLDLPLLKSVSLMQCKKLTEVALRSPGLVAVNVTQCSLLSRIDVTSSEVETLALREQLGLTSIALQCPRLRQVDLSDCDSLTNSVFDVFSEGGGCPLLSSLILDNCEGLSAVKLATKQLSQLSLVGCRNINSIELACPALESLLLDGCGRLANAALAPIGLSELNLGICPHLAKLEVQGTKMTQLDLRGCGALSEATLACPQLVSLDASYCSQLSDSCLAAIAENCPSIQSLVLFHCPNITPVGLLALRKLPELTTLDLSYTFLTELTAVFEACPGLQVLQLSACKYLEGHALKPLYEGHALPHLQQLDISYGSLGKGAVEDLLALAPHLVTVSLNGCENISDAIWQCISMPPVPGGPVGPAAIVDVEMGEQEETEGDICMQGFSGEAGGVYDRDAVVRGFSGTSFDQSRGMGALEDRPAGFAGDLVGATGSRTGTETEHAGLGQDRKLQALSAVGCSTLRSVCIPSSASCTQLLSLNLSLAQNVSEVRLACPNLNSLNLSNCSSLVDLDLQCPRLTSLCLQGCALDGDILEQAVLGCPQLETLDIRNCAKMSTKVLTHIRNKCPWVRRLYHSLLG